VIVGVFILDPKEKAACVLVPLHEYSTVPQVHFPCVRKTSLFKIDLLEPVILSLTGFYLQKEKK